jgi:hypothetical protein
MYVCLLRVLNQYGTHWNKNTPTTAMIRTVGQLKESISQYSKWLSNFEFWLELAWLGKSVKANIASH